MRTRFFRGLGGGIAGLIILCALATSAADKTPPTEPVAKPDEAAEAQQQTLRSYLQLQEQLHNTLLTIERTRKEADTAAKANAEAIAARLEAIEQALSAQQSHQANLLVNSNRITLISAGVFAGLGLLAMIFTAWFLVRAMHRLATVAGSFPGGHALGGGQAAAAFVSADLHHIEVAPGEESGSRLLGVINRLEKKINDLEHTSHSALPANSGSPQSAPTNGALESKRVSVEARDRAAETSSRPADPASHISAILKKGQELLDQEKAEDAITCFDEALGIDPRNAEALVKKGTALERLKKLEEAIRCYDHAIAANRSMTLAYLYKGGACNQLERFSEALECYEMALRSQRSA